MINPSQELVCNEKLLQNEVEYIAREISNRIVVEPSIDEEESDILISIKCLNKGVEQMN